MCERNGISAMRTKMDEVIIEKQEYLLFDKYKLNTNRNITRYEYISNVPLKVSKREPDMRVHFHKTDSTNSVKPCICHFFHYRFKASCMNLVYQFSSLLTLFFVKCYLCSCCCPIYLKICTFCDCFTAIIRCDPKHTRLLNQIHKKAKRKCSF